MLNNATQATYITQQPTNQVAAEGQNTTMTVGSVHATWFQWRRDGVNLTNSPPFNGVTTIAINDLNVDGRLDLAMANPASQTTSILIGNGDGTFAPTVNYGTGAPGMMFTIGDVNGDGKPDLATANYNNHNVSVLLNTGLGTFAPGVTFSTGTNPNFVAIGDLNGDGKPDPASANFNGQNVSVLLNNGPSIGFTPQPLSPSVTPGANVVFTATASGTGPFTYQWRRNGQPIIGATTGTLTINNVTSVHTDAYDVQVRGGCNPLAIATSKTAVLTLGTCKGDFNNGAAFNAADIQIIVNALLAGQTCP